MAGNISLVRRVRRFLAGLLLITVVTWGSFAAAAWLPESFFLGDRQQVLVAAITGWFAAVVGLLVFVLGREGSPAQALGPVVVRLLISMFALAAIRPNTVAGLRLGGWIVAFYLILLVAEVILFAWFAGPLTGSRTE